MWSWFAAFGGISSHGSPVAVAHSHESRFDGMGPGCGKRFHLPLIAAVLLAAAAPVQAADLLDFVIEAIDPTLAPARPLIECLAGGGSAEQCALEAAKKQATGALPIGPGDDRVQLAAKVFIAARDERWLDVVNVGGQAVAKFVACAMIPVQGPMKGTICDIVGWIITNQAGALNKAYQALKGPDWWELVYVLGASACNLIPGDGAAGYARDVLCGPLAAALLEAKKWALAMGASLVGVSDELENLVFGDDSHMPYDRYFALYWQPWYHYSTARVFNGQGLGPAVDSTYSRCVDYFDSHNQYRKTAKKTCNNLNSKFNTHVKGFAEALPVAVDGYFKWVAKPAIRGAVAASYGKPASGPPPGQQFFVQNCAFQMRKNIYFPEPDDMPCQLLAHAAKKLEKDILTGPLFKGLASACFKNVELQDVQPTVWAQACDEMRAPYGQVFAGETLKLAKTISDLNKAGCVKTAQETSGKLLMVCHVYGAYSACLEKFHPNGGTYCHMEALKMTDTQAAQGLVPVTAGGVVLSTPAAANSPESAQTARAAGPVTASRNLARGTPTQAAPPESAAPSASPSRAAVSALSAQVRPLVTPFEAEGLLSGGRVEVRGGQAAGQAMAGFGPGWSGDAQLFWHGGSPGATLDLLIEVPRDGAWKVEIDLTQAPDYGQLGFEVDGHPVADGFDGYAPQVAGPVSLALGTFAMQQGLRRVSLKITGQNRAATGWLVGVDRVRLLPGG